MNTLFDLPQPQETNEAAPLGYRGWVSDRELLAEQRAKAAAPTPENPSIVALRAQLDLLRAQQASELEEARVSASEEAQAAAEAHFREALEVERTSLAHACASLARERSRYFAEVQREVVRLALAVAERVLHHEVKADAAAMAEVVRVAVSQLADPSGAILRVSSEEVERWRRALRHTGLRVETEEALRPGGLRLESMGGGAELGWKAQLDEIERSFDEMLERRA